MKKIRRYRRKKQKKLIIIGSMSLLLFLCVGYAAFSTNLSLKAKGNIKERTDFYVSANGSDISGNGSKEKPYATIEKAYDSAPTQATIYIMTDLIINEGVYLNEKDIILQSAEGIDTVSLIRGNNYKGSLLSQYRGKVVIRNIILDGNNVEANSALFSAEYSDVNLEYGTIFQNNVDSEDMGGGARVVNSNVIIDGAKFLNNTTQHQPGGGGAGILSRFSNITIENGEFIGNTSKYSTGGAIFFGDNGYKLIINNGVFKENYAFRGGAITIASSELEINNVDMKNNIAEDYGGAIYIYELDSNIGNGISVFTMNNGNINNNTAISNGGGIYIAKGHKYNYMSGSITNNTPNDIYQE